MEPIDIKHAIEKAGFTQSDIARRRGVSRSLVNAVIWYGAVSDHVRREIASVIGKPVEDIWPEYYKRAVNN